MFLQLVFRTVGFSGADIRNLVNESAIMSVSFLLTLIWIGRVSLVVQVVANSFASSASGSGLICLCLLR